ncbi:hypothetical protein HSB1_32600 [Halogranum salarium B-1]|uniref:Uncharacterized protein n=1 Tax=Halogranum salarium B-1 TaxID=1210908 RepID=J2ZXU7_9EURY|nr:hypothetical protein HSB1_32600 [Halogranum salarium B-1]
MSRRSAREGRLSTTASEASEEHKESVGEDVAVAVAGHRAS